MISFSTHALITLGNKRDPWLVPISIICIPWCFLLFRWIVWKAMFQMFAIQTTRFLYSHVRYCFSLLVSCFHNSVVVSNQYRWNKLATSISPEHITYWNSWIFSTFLSSLFPPLLQIIVVYVGHLLNLYHQHWRCAPIEQLPKWLKLFLVASLFTSALSAF